MKTLSTALLTLTLAFVAGAAHAKKKVELPAVDRAAIHASLKKVGLMPMRVPSVVPNADAVAQRFEAAFTQRLQAAGFEVVPADAMREINANLDKAMGGIYDPLTGDASSEKIEARAKFARNEYLATYKVDGFAYPLIHVRDASSQSMWAEWDGVKERVTGQSVMKSVFTYAGAMGDGIVPALSLALVLEDRDGKQLYGRYGGLQLLAYLRMGWAPKYHDVDPAYLLTDPERDTRALARVFDPLTGEQSATQDTKISLPPAAQAVEQGALRVSREELLRRKRVALSSLDIGDIGQRDEVRARYAGYLRASLAAAGFEVVPEADFAALWEARRRASGGFFDPYTGRLDAARVRAARKEVLQQLAADHGVTAVVFPKIAMRSANMASGSVKWDGAEQTITGGGSKFTAMLGAAGRYVGRLDALSLQLRIADLDDVTLFEDFGGIHSLSRFEHGRFVDLPESQLFSEPERDAAAVELAMAEITGKPGAQRAR